jgi:hypothetical protein
MTIVNRRNAVIGWVMVMKWKRNARRKADRARGRLGSRRGKSS